MKIIQSKQTYISLISKVILFIGIIFFILKNPFQNDEDTRKIILESEIEKALISLNLEVKSKYAGSAHYNSSWAIVTVPQNSWKIDSSRKLTDQLEQQQGWHQIASRKNLNVVALCKDGMLIEIGGWCEKCEETQINGTFNDSSRKTCRDAIQMRQSK